MQKLIQKRLSIIAICLLFAQTLFGSLPAFAQTTSNGQSHVGNTVTTSSTMIQGMAASADSAAIQTITVTTPASASISYFTDTDNWGGGAADSPKDNDLDFSLKNQKNHASDSNDYERYPVEVKIEGVDQLPTKNAYLLVRGYDVDEYNPLLAASGEWLRVYFSSNSSNIALGPNYTGFPNTG